MFLIERGVRPSHKRLVKTITKFGEYTKFCGSTFPGLGIKPE
jgi:hypothetical protein